MAGMRASAQQPRVYERDWQASPWRGSLEELVSAAQAAVDEMIRQAGELTEQELAMGAVLEHGSIDFADGSKQAFDSLSKLMELTSIDPSEFEEISIILRVRTSKVSLRGGFGGLSVSAEGSEAFAAGIVATLKSRLAGGAEAGRQAAVVPLRLIDWFLLALAPIVFVGVQIYLYGYFDSDDAVGNAFMGFLIAGVPAAVASFVIPDGKDKRRPSPFALVREGAQFPDEDERQTGPVWRAKAWFDKHPALALVLVLLIGALLGRAADLIQF